MKYYYKIVSSWDPTDIPIDRMSDKHAKGYDSYEQACLHGEATLKAMNLDPDQYYVKIVEVKSLVNQLEINKIF